MGDDMGGFKHGGPLSRAGMPPGGLPQLIAMLLMLPEKLGGSGDDVLKEMRERVWRDNMDERYGIGWSPDPVETPRINPGRRIDLSRVMRAGR